MREMTARIMPLFIFEREKAQDMPDIAKNMKSTIG